MATDTELMDQGEFGKYWGVSGTMVGKYIRAGKIPDNCFEYVVENKRKRKKIKPLCAAEALAKTLDRTKQSTASKKAKANARKKPKAKPTPEQKQEVIKDAGIEVLPLHEAQALDKTYSAALKKLDLEIKQGELISKSEVSESAFRAGRLIKEQLGSIPDRCAPLVAVESDQFECKQILLKEINHILNDLSEKLRVME